LHLKMAGSLLIRLVALAQLVWVSVDASYTWDDVTPLDEYVHSDDGYWSYEYLAQYEYNGVDLYVVNMTSQKYQDESFVSKSIWWHIMGIAIPKNILYPDAGFLFIDGGSNRDDTTAPPRDDIGNIAIALLANDTGTVGAYIKQVPNQPVVFSNDPTQRVRSEDRIISWTWRTYIDSPNPDPTVILRMPMTKAAKRGLDTVAAVAKEKAPETDINRFVVSGASKRGWTTWSIGCTDRRVIAIIPMVFSLLHMEEAVQNHFQNMNGAWSFAFVPYWGEGLTAEFYTPATDGVWDVEDMHRYRARLDGVPKLLMVASGDEFFLCDDSQSWWDEMPGPKYLKMLPNAEHSMAPHYIRIYETAAAFWSTILENLPLPEVTWTLQETPLGGYIIFNTNPPPYNITAFSATTLVNETRRDFRLAALNENGETVIHPVAWRQNINIADAGDGRSWITSVEKVPDRWVGFFFQAIWLGPEPNNYRMYLTSQVNIVPYTWPHGRCYSNEECYGYLV
jgi:PhoPQ-activated pathogenicity-related protein